LNKRLGGPQTGFVRPEEEKNVLSVQGLEPVTVNVSDCHCAGYAYSSPKKKK